MHTEKYTGHTYVGETRDATDFIRFVAGQKIRPVCMLKDMVEWTSIEEFTSIDTFFLGRASYSPPILRSRSEFKRILEEPLTVAPYGVVTIDGVKWWLGKPVNVKP